LRVQRLVDRAVGGGFVLMLAAAVLWGSFLLSSLYLQNVLGTEALETGGLRSCRSPSRWATASTPPVT